LDGSGKKMRKKETNKYVDFVTHKMNKVMIENGLNKEWIKMKKEI
jgi:DnaJ family protein C protein 28